MVTSQEQIDKYVIESQALQIKSLKKALDICVSDSEKLCLEKNVEIKLKQESIDDLVALVSDYRYALAEAVNGYYYIRNIDDPESAFTHLYAINSYPVPERYL